MKKVLLLVLSSMLIASSFSIEGMTCGVGCVNKIMAEIGTLDGVKVCDVDFEKGIMTVDYTEDTHNAQILVKDFLPLVTFLAVAEHINVNFFVNSLSFRRINLTYLICTLSSS